LKEWANGVPVRNFQDANRLPAIARLDCATPVRGYPAGVPVKPLNEIVPVLQMAIGPVILISGVGLLLLTMTNRLGRAIDRARSLVRELREGREHDREQVLAQVAIIYRRAKVIRLTIVLASLSVLLASVLIISLFMTALFRWEEGLAISLIFVACMGSLIASLVTFIYDIHLSLVALKLELKPVKPDLG
jgi:hypothetical protein